MVYHHRTLDLSQHTISISKFPLQGLAGALYTPESTRLPLYHSSGTAHADYTFFQAHFQHYCDLRGGALSVSGTAVLLTGFTILVFIYDPGRDFALYFGMERHSGICKSQTYMQSQLLNLLLLCGCAEGPNA
jgi:hypothetical protein